MKQVPTATPSISIKVVPTSRGNTVENKWGHTFSVGENANQITNEIGIAIVIATMTDPIVHASILFRLRPRIEKIAQSYDDPKQVLDWYYADAARLGQFEGVVVEELQMEKSFYVLTQLSSDPVKVL